MGHSLRLAALLAASTMAVVSAQPRAGAALVRAWEGTLTLPTYQEGPADENPPFDLLATGRFLNYPYTIRENLTNRRAPQTWRALFVENDYLKVTVLPDLGGHLYSCVDKVNGAEMFYANRSIKKANIGYRGAWAALGVEFNFPVSHNWVSVSPVDYAIERRADGSAAVVVGNIDRVYHMQWQVELRLHPRSSLLEQQMTLYNRGDVRRRFYWWNNAAVQVWDDSRILYPMTFTASHGFTHIDTWPVNQNGLDLSVVRNHTQGPVSQFSHGSRERFMGVYHPRTRAGVVHYAEGTDAPSKKIWSWGVDPEGLAWRTALSDDESAYVEIQAGLFRNQETYGFLEPQERLQFREYWLPLRDIGGVARANTHGALNLARDAGAARLDVGFLPTHDIAGARIRVKRGDAIVHAERRALTPAAPYTKSVQVGGGDAPLTFELADSSGRVLLTHTDGKYDVAPRDDVAVGPTRRTAAPPAVPRDALVERGRAQELEGRNLPAMDLYREALARDAQDPAANKAAGRLAVALKRFDEAAPLLQAALARGSNDGEALYYLGLAAARTGDAALARESLEAAQLHGRFASAARLQLAALDALTGDAAAALKSLRRTDGTLTPRAGAMEVALLRRLGRRTEALERLRHWQRVDPLSGILRHEAVRLGAADATSWKALWTHLSADPERVLDAAAEYMQFGFWDDALGLLAREYPETPATISEPGTVRPQAHPLIAYYRGYCRVRLGQSGARDFTAASGLSTRYVFPHRPETGEILRTALATNASDATAHFLLGSWLMSGGRADRAIEEWQDARSLSVPTLKGRATGVTKDRATGVTKGRDTGVTKGRATEPHLPTLHRNIGATLMRTGGAVARALEVFLEGLSADPLNAENYAGVDQALSLMRRPAGERVEALRRYPDQRTLVVASGFSRTSTLPTTLVFKLALALAEDGQQEAADALFRDRFFARQEGGLDARQVYIEVQLLGARRAAAEQRCDAARAMLQGHERAPFPAERLAPFRRGPRYDYLAGAVERRCGDDAGAGVRDARAAAAGGGTDARGGVPALVFGYHAARRSGSADLSLWRSKLAAALESAEAALAAPGGAAGAQAYAAGLLHAALGHAAQARARFEEALRLPDRALSHHLSREALKEIE